MPTSAALPHARPTSVSPESPRAGAGTWQRIGLAAAALAVVLVVNVPAFLRMPLDCDPLLFDLYVRDMGRGAVLYRDMLENNTPGMIALHAAVRSALGWSPEALRAADLLVVGAAVGLLGWWSNRGRPDLRLFTVTLLTILYLSTSEWCHAQRDVWMLLPVMVALYLRRAQAGRLVSGRAWLGGAVAEGTVWGLAVWIKPHVVLVAGPAWLVATVWARSRGAGWRSIGVDAAGTLAGGLAVGSAGVGLMAAFGLWAAYVEHLTGWVGEYYQGDLYKVYGPWLMRLGVVFRNTPWSLAYLAAVPVAVALALGPVRAWLRGRRPGDRLDSPLLAAALAGWAFQAWGLQHIFDYVHVAGMMLAVALLAGSVGDLSTPALRRTALATLALIAGIGHVGLFRDRAAVWSECVRGGSPELRDRLPLIGRIRWADLGRVSDYLQSQKVKSGEVAVLSDSALPVWELTGLRPPTRYYIAHNNLLAYPGHRAEILATLAANPAQRFVVCDLAALRWGKPPAGSEGKPAEEWPLPADWHGPRRWADRVVFRAGRYLVLVMPAADLPAWMADVNYFMTPGEVR